MDTKNLIEARATALDEMDKALAALTEAKDDDARAEARAAFEGAEAEVDRIDANIRDADRAAEKRAKQPATPNPTPTVVEPVLEKRGEVKVGREPLTYEKGGPNSFVRDLLMANRPDFRDSDAQERLARHMSEMRIERRDISTTDTTSVGEMIPPLWAVDMYAPIRRAGRPLANAIGPDPLPRGTDTIIIPRVTTGGSVHFQTAENATIAEQDMVTGGTAQAPIKTIAGQLDVSLQSVEWGAISMIDQFYLRDLYSLHANRVETGVGQGTGTNGQITGILGTSGTNSVTYTSASPTAGSLYSKSADAIQQIHTGTFFPPDLIVMHPRRWAHLLAASDTTGRPLVVPAPQAPQNSMGGFGGVVSEDFVGTMQGLPVLTSAAAIPTNDSAGTTNDVVLVIRRGDLHLWESPTFSRVHYETLNGQLSVRIQVYSYLAFTAGKYPASISAIRGTGLATPSF